MVKGADRNDQEQEFQLMISRLVSRRGQLKGQLTRFKKFVTDSSNNSKITEISTRMQRMELIFDEFNKVQEEIEQYDESEQNFSERVIFEDDYYETVAKAKEFVGQFGNQAQNSLFMPQQNNSDFNIQSSRIETFNVKLPPLSLPEFDGSYDKWVTFYDAFSALIHNNPNLGNIQKFYYLQTALKKEAIKIIDSLEVTDSNYPVAWELLKERYQNKKFIIKNHIKQIFDLPNVNRDSVESLRFFVDNLQKHYRALRNLKEPVEQWSTILIHLLSSKLDTNSRKEWEIETKDVVSPTSEIFIQFLIDRCKLLESIDNKYLNKSSSSNYHNTHHKSVTTKIQSNISTRLLSCIFCKGDHLIYYCNEFLKLSISDRINTIRKLKACTNCLRLGHKGSNCQGSSCRICDKKHNSLLHLSTTNKTTNQNSNIADKHNISNDGVHAFVNNPSQSLPIKSDDNKKQAERDNNELSVVACSQNSLTLTAYDNDSFVLLTTALLRIVNKNGESVLCRALLDAGSQSNFMSQDLFERLNIQGTDVDIKVIGINGNISYVNNVIKTRIKSINSNYNVNLQFLVSDQITTDTPHMDFDVSNLKIPDNINLADPRFNESSKNDILLGAGIFYHLLLPGQISLGKGRPILQNTELGWIVAGTISCPNINNRNFSVCNLSTSINSLENVIEKFWLIEEAPSLKNNYTEEENEVEIHFQQTYSRDNYGNFVVRLPFRDNLEHLGESFDIAVKRFQFLERKLIKNPILKENCSKFINEYINLGHMSEHNNFNLQPNFFLPHHAVIKESSITTRLRVVFDASSKCTSGLSLNDILKTGPCIQDTLFFILLRFRLFPIVVSADIAKMYRCVKIHENDTKFQLILWRNNPTDSLKIYKLLTVTYGMSTASFLATRCLKQLALDNEINYPEAAQSILKDFYMDDYLVSVKDIQSACFLIKDVNNILLSGGFRLRQWSSNNEQVLNFVSQLDSSTKTDYIIKDEQSCSKTLGTVWNSSKDILKYVTHSEPDSDQCKIFTKRRILSVISQIFDILGLIGPVITRAKLFMQKLWTLKIGWDDPVPNNFLISWLQFYNNLRLIENLKIPRPILIINFISIEMHVFTDASQHAYGTAIYFRSVNSLNIVDVNLVCSKSRVAPVKVISIPRLELCAALLGVELAHTVIKATENEIKIDKIFYWCDSTIVLSWISSESSKLKTFVANRVSKIQTFSHSYQWRYIPTDMNPADYISRGVDPEETQQLDSWFFGPKFLLSDDQYWPNNIEIQSNTDLPELKQPHSKILLTKECDKFDVFYRYSSFNKCIRVVAYLLRFKNNLAVKLERRNLDNLKISELDEARIAIIKHFQCEHFAIEIKDLLRHGQVSKKSKLFRLSVFLDERGIIRVGGRLKNADLNFDNKHPIVLPAKCHLTSLIVRHFHFKYLHAGPQTLLSIIRQNYWLMQGRNSVRGILRKCVICFKVSPSPGLQKMADLPATRVQPSRIFSILGVDYTGPFLIKNSFLRNTKSIKAWICIFVCFASKAVHIELVTELSTNSFLNALKRLIARRGFPSDIYSDNGTNFVGASNLINEIKDDVFQKILIDNRITWHFIPPRSPHHII